MDEHHKDELEQKVMCTEDMGGVEECSQYVKKEKVSQIETKDSKRGNSATEFRMQGKVSQREMMMREKSPHSALFKRSMCGMHNPFLLCIKNLSHEQKCSSPQQLCHLGEVCTGDELQIVQMTEDEVANETNGSCGLACLP